MNREMLKALEADGEKLRQLTGEDHGPHFLDDVCRDGCQFAKDIAMPEHSCSGECQYLMRKNGYGVR